MSVVTINGVTFNVPDGSTISVVNGIVQINGKNADGVVAKEYLKIDVSGSLVNLSVDRGDVTVQGDVHQNIYTNSSVKVSGNVKGNLDAGGSVNCGNVGGDVDAGGSVNCGNVEGDVDAGGSVVRR